MILEFLKAVQLNENFSLAQYNLGMLYMMRKDFFKAEGWLIKAVETMQNQGINCGTRISGALFSNKVLNKSGLGIN